MSLPAPSMAESRVDSVKRAGGLVSSSRTSIALGGGGFPGADGDEFVLAGGDAGAAAVDFEPAGFDEDAAFGLEGVGRSRGDAGEAGGLLELGVRVEDGDEALDDHVVELLPRCR